MKWCRTKKFHFSVYWKILLPRAELDNRCWPREITFKFSKKLENDEYQYLIHSYLYIYNTYLFIHLLISTYLHTYYDHICYDNYLMNELLGLNIYSFHFWGNIFISFYYYSSKFFISVFLIFHVKTHIKRKFQSYNTAWDKWVNGQFWRTDCNFFSLRVGEVPTFWANLGSWHWFCGWQNSLKI